MINKFLLPVLAFFMLQSGCAQTKDITSNLFESYESYRENSLEKRRIKHEDLQPLINQYRVNPRFTVKTVGRSIEGRELSLISIGRGETQVFLWSQMHGDEPTATQAIFDILNFFDSPDMQKEKSAILRECTVHFLPMLNPDGASVFKRRNTLGIDINRDALMLQSPESQTLKRVRDSLDADFGFNLHDQSRYYNAERTEKPATISYLAPAYNYEKDINEVRGNAMRVIVFMNDIIQKYAPGQVGRYNDDFEPRAFGDNIQKWGTSTILIESGGYPEDREKQEIRKLNYVSILSAIYTIANKSYAEIPLESYDRIPENDRKLFDLKLEKLNYELLGKRYILDVGIYREEKDNDEHTDFWYISRINDQGDLSTYYGYETFDASLYTLEPGKVFPEVISSLERLNQLDPLDLLRKGFTHLRMERMPSDLKVSTIPLHMVTKNYVLPEFHLEPGRNATFLLKRGGEIKWALVNGFLIDLDSGKTNFKNALILR